MALIAGCGGKDEPDQAAADVGVDASPDAGVVVDPCEADPCANGTCEATSEGFSCECEAGYEGDLCDVDIDDCEGDPCQNGGTCVDGVDSFSCECAAGYEGDLCDIDVDDCADDPCQNGGTCVDGVDSFSCMCPTGYVGDHCETEVDSCDDAPCQNGGVCTNLAGVGLYECACADGYYGANCDVACDQGNCTGTVSCDQADGANRVCTGCEAGFYGADCASTCDQGNCTGTVSCDQADGANRVCTGCAEGYAGTDCTADFDACASTPCFDNGVVSATCTDHTAPDPGYTCGACPAGYEGDGVTCVDVVDWFQIWGDDNDDTQTAADVSADAAGNVYMTGVFIGDIEILGTSYLVDRFGGYIASFDADGVLRWQTGFGVPAVGTLGGDLNPVTTVLEPVSGDIVAVGDGFGGDAMIGGTVYPDVMPGTQETAFVTLLDSATGATQWVTFFGGSAIAVASDATIAANGDIAVIGSIHGSHDFGNGITISSGNFRSAIFVVTFDPLTGAATSAFTFGDNTDTDELPLAIDTLPGGDFVIAGFWRNSISTTDGEFGTVALPYSGDDSHNAFVGRITPTGTTVHVNYMTDSGQEFFRDVHVEPGGDYFVSGDFRGTASFGGQTFTLGYDTPVLARIDGATGTIEWVTGGTNISLHQYQGLRRFAVDSNGDLRMALNLASNNGTFGTSATNFGIRDLAKTTLLRVNGATGAVEAERYIDAAGVMYSGNIALTPDDRAIFGGSFDIDGLLYGEAFDTVGLAGHDHYLMEMGVVD